MVEAANTFVWMIGNFQDYVKRTSKGESFTSPKFWMPQKCDDTKPTLWRLHLYPNGDLGAENDRISVSLEAIRTPFEKLNDVNKREQRHKIGIGRSVVRSSDSSKTMIKAVTSDQHHYDLNRPSATWNLENFISLDEIFPGRNRSQPVDIFIQITLIDPDKGFETDEGVYKRFKELYDDESLADVEFTFDCDKKVKAHRIILAMESEYFKQKFQGEWREEKVIRMEDTNCCAFRAVVYFIYTGGFLFRGSVGCCGLIHFYNEVHKLADMMRLDRLKLLIAEEMPRSINDRNWDKFLSLGWKTKNQFLKDTVLEYVTKNWEKVKRGEGMRRLLIVANDEVEELEELFSIVNKRKQMSKWPDDRLPRPNVRIVRRI